MRTLHIIEEQELSMVGITRANLAQLLKAGNLTVQQRETINDALLTLKFAR